MVVLYWVELWSPESGMRFWEKSMPSWLSNLTAAKELTFSKWKVYLVGCWIQITVVLAFNTNKYLVLITIYKYFVFSINTK